MAGLSVPKRLEAALSPDKDSKNIFDTKAAVASGSTISIVSFTVPSGKIFFLDLVEFGGGNIATYELFIGASAEAKKRTYFSGSISGEFFFNSFIVNENIKIDLKVENFRPDIADFEGRILGVLDDKP